MRQLPSINAVVITFLFWTIWFIASLRLVPVKLKWDSRQVEWYPNEVVRMLLVSVLAYYTPVVLDRLKTHWRLVLSGALAVVAILVVHVSIRSCTKHLDWNGNGIPDDIDAHLVPLNESYTP
jgi:hypothetical protein